MIKNIDNNIEITKEYTFRDNHSIAYYTLQVTKYSSVIDSHGTHGEVRQFSMPNNFAYEIAKKIVEEYERMNNND